MEERVQAAINAGALQPQHTCSVEGNQSPLLSSLGPHFDYTAQCALDSRGIARNVAGERRALTQARAALHHAVLAASDNKELLLLLHYPPFRAMALHALGFRSEEYHKLRSLPAAEHMSAEEFLLFKAKGFWKDLKVSVVKNIMVQDEFIEHVIACEVEVDSEDTSDQETIWLVKRRYTEFKELFQKLQKLLPAVELSIPGRTFVPGKWKRPATVVKRQKAFDKFLNDVLEWLQAAIDDEAQQDVVTQVIELMEDFLDEPGPRLRKPTTNPTEFHLPLLAPGWYRGLALPNGVLLLDEEAPSPAEEQDIHLGFETVHCEALAYLCEDNCAIKGVHLQNSSAGSTANAGLAPLLQHLAHEDCALFRLSLGGFNLTHKVDDTLDAAFKGNKSLLSLSFVGGFGGVGLDHPGALLRAMMIPTLQSLNLSGALGQEPVHAEHLQLITDWLEGPSQLRRLFLDSNNIGDEGAKHLAVALAANSSLEVLSLRQSQVSPNGLIELFSALKHNCALQVLHVVDRPSMLPLGAAAVKDVAHGCQEMLSTNKALLELDLTGQFLSDHALKIAEALQTNSTLQRLMLGNNRFFAGPVLESLLAPGCELRSLDLSSNDLMDEEAALADGWLVAFKEACHLEELHLPWLNHAKFVGPLLAAVAELPALKKLVLGGAVDKAQEGVLAELLASCSSLEILHLQSGDRGAYGLHDALLHAPALHAIHWHTSCSEATAFLDKLEAWAERKIDRLLFSFEEAGIHHDIFARVDAILCKQG